MDINAIRRAYDENPNFRQCIIAFSNLKRSFPKMTVQNLIRYAGGRDAAAEVAEKMKETGLAFFDEESSTLIWNVHRITEFAQKLVAEHRAKNAVLAEGSAPDLPLFETVAPLTGSLSIETIDLDAFARKLLQLMSRRKLKQSEVAERTGIPFPIISLICRCEKRPTIEQIEKLASLFDVRPEQLTAGTPLDPDNHELKAIETRIEKDPCVDPIKNENAVANVGRTARNSEDRHSILIGLLQQQTNLLQQNMQLIGRLI